MVIQEYNQIIREYFDLSDRNTTRFITKINEADQQTQLLAALANSLYQKIVDKADKIDFGSIPRSRGDITKVDGYFNTVECINIIRRLVLEYKEDPSIIDIELNAIESIKSLRPVFMKGFNNNSSFVITYYNLAVASIQHSVSFLIAVAIQFVKDPNTKDIKMALDKAAYKDAESNMLLDNLARLNKTFNDGSLEKLLRESMNSIAYAESVEADEYSEDTASLTNGVNDAIDDAPVEEELDEDVMLIDISGEHAPEDEHLNNNDPFADDDELSAGANNPDTLPGDDEVDPTPIIPINGAGESEGTESIGEDRNSAVKRPYHKHFSANAGYGSKSIKEGFVRDAVGGLFNASDGKEKASFIKNVFSFGKKAALIGTALVGSWLAITKIILPAMRRAAALISIGRANLSESLAVQANLIELNALDLQRNENSNLTDEKKAKVIEKQMKIAQVLRSLSDKIAIKDKKNAKEVEKELEEEKRKNKSRDMQKYLPKDIADDNDLF